MPDWTASYYEALEFFYREPQHIGCRTHAGDESGTLAEVMQHLHLIEATLDQNLRQFFLLAPTLLRNELFASLFTRRFSHPLTLLRNDVVSEFGPEHAMQSGLLFVSDIEAVVMEVTLERRQSLTQVLEYALMTLAMELHLGAPRRHCFVLVGAGDFPSQWQEQYASVTELKIALGHEDSALFLRTRADRLRKHEDRFMELVASLDMAFLSFADFATSLREAAPPDTDVSPGAEVYRNLIAGMLAELDRRRLVE